MFSNNKKQLLLRLNTVLKQYADMANADPNKLRCLIPAQDIWRLHVDGVMQSKGWRVYDFREPGCLLAMHKAFDWLWIWKRKINSSVVLKIHELATKNVSGTNYSCDENLVNKSEVPGYFRQDSFINYTVGGCYLTDTNLTKTGLREYLHKKNKPNSEHAISIEVNELGDQTSTFEDIIINKDFVRDARKIVKGARTLSNRSILKSMSNYFYNDLLRYLDNKSTNDLTPYIELIKFIGNTKDDYELANELYYFVVDRDSLPIRSKVKILMVSIQRKNPDEQLFIDSAEILDQYYLRISHVESPMDKLVIIINTVQSLEQLHPFSDANCRTFCMLLLNKLLVENGFPLAILPDPNRFDMYSISELVKEVIKGMENTFKLIKNQQLYNYKVQDDDFHDGYFKKLYDAELIARQQTLFTQPDLTRNNLSMTTYH